EDALEELSITSHDDYPILLQKCAEDFYADSTEKERLELLDFAIKLIKADDKIDDEENLLVNKLYQYWDIN
ncbi:MAG: putative tellurite resistance protein B-like protein, partial [Bacteroidia bacterium]